MGAPVRNETTTEEEGPMTHPSHDDGSPFDLSIPFVVCESVGGPFDDAAYLSGFELGVIYARLVAAKAVDAHIDSVVVHDHNVPQLTILTDFLGILADAPIPDDGYSRVPLRWF